MLSAANIPESTLLAMWHHVFIRGFHACPSLGFLSSGVSALNAILLYHDEVYSTGSWLPSASVYTVLLSGFFMFGMVPYTLMWIVPLEELLLRRERELAKPEDKMNTKSELCSGQQTSAETRKMLELWVTLNYYRMVIPFVGVTIAWTLL